MHKDIHDIYVNVVVQNNNTNTQSWTHRHTITLQRLLKINFPTEQFCFRNKNEDEMLHLNLVITLC